jgi:serine O-acetyltransferase
MKKDLIKKIFYFFYCPAFFPLLLPWWITNQREIIRGDLARWLKIWRLDAVASGYTLIFMCMKNSVWRTIFFHRLKCGNTASWLLGEILSWLYRPLPTLKIFTQDIGPGLFIQHGYCTMISAKRIGTNAWINQGVTIGYTNGTDCPTTGNNVTIAAGAKILGDVSVGDHVKVGANAVVVKNVPDNTTVVGVPARIIRKNGQRVSEELV